MNVSSSCSPVFRKKGQWRKELDLIGEWMFQEELANKHRDIWAHLWRMNSSLLGQDRQESDSKGKGLTPLLKAGHTLGGRLHLLSSPGVGGGGSDEICLATVSHFNSSFHPFLFIHSATGTDHKSTPLYISKKLLAHKLLLRLCFFKESITYNIMNATTWYLK